MRVVLESGPVEMMVVDKEVKAICMSILNGIFYVFRQGPITPRSDILDKAFVGSC